MMQHLLFPQLTGKWTEVNLNEIALAMNVAVGDTDPATEGHLIEQLHRQLGVDYSYGGWLEHRDFLLRNKYNAEVGPDHFWHLGIDYNVSAGTEVHLPCDARLVYATHDRDQNGGWGGMQFFWANGGYFILGHLGEFATGLGEYLKGGIVGTVGEREVNGGWFPHLHVQRCKNFNPEVDGYSHFYEGIREDYPDPQQLCL